MDAALCVFCRTRPVDPAWRPFCSERCKLQDLGRWLDESYRIPETRADEGTAAPLRSSNPMADTVSVMADTLTVVDNRTGKQYELPIQDGTIRAMDLRKIKAAPD